ncbi:hypothetical protein BCR44DRAFT_1133906 [Catenaria anguillulae PL171]|uniref:Uncharacterized protein n=1 Tax=Catenaria anguillulae PL171 TaxID=765915 RepID=A0A1Y2HMY4_9FUNG|nr:hypothetical protein BCR44DRAFT_1133906 [Catenaria anguillulae PL171]
MSSCSACTRSISMVIRGTRLIMMRNKRPPTLALPVISLTQASARLTTARLAQWKPQCSKSLTSLTSSTVSAPFPPTTHQQIPRLSCDWPPCTAVNSLKLDGMPRLHRSRFPTVHHPRLAY